jgi:RNA polymerase sigma-70 factor (ECF subfamily)
MERVDGHMVRTEALAGGQRAKAAFELFWTAYHRRLGVFATAFRGLPAADADDEAANALIDAFGALERYDPERPLGPCVYRIARNRFAIAAKRAARVSSVSVGPDNGDGRNLVIDPSAPGDHAADAAAKDIAERYRVFLATLPETDRRIAFLCISEGLDSREAGQALGMPAGTVRWQLSGIRACVRAAVGEDTP